MREVLKGEAGLPVHSLNRGDGETVQNQQNIQAFESTNCLTSCEVFFTVPAMQMILRTSVSQIENVQ